jgi:hypothetical protein
MKDNLLTERIAPTSADAPTRRVTARRISLLLSALAVLGTGTMTVACSPRGEKPAETSVPAPSATPTEKGMHTNVTRSPMSVSPQGPGGGNPAVPCGFGPAGGGPCSNN